VSKHLEREMNNLKKSILGLGALVEQNVAKAVRALEERNAVLAREVIDSDSAVDQMEVDIEEECLKVLALYQPVAVDLRVIVSILKINNDLERVGDLAVNIAERSIYLSSRERPDIPLNFPVMAEKAKAMLQMSLDALVNMDVKGAHRVMLADDEVDAINREMYGTIQQGIRRKPEQLECLIHLLSTSRHLERIADLATNIAEDVIYMIEGEIVRHHTEEYGSSCKDDE
jgi:phosphate transport system protein